MQAGNEDHHKQGGCGFPCLQKAPAVETPGRWGGGEQATK